MVSSTSTLTSSPNHHHHHDEVFTSSTIEEQSVVEEMIYFDASSAQQHHKQQRSSLAPDCTVKRRSVISASDEENLQGRSVVCPNAEQAMTHRSLQTGISGGPHQVGETNKNQNDAKLPPWEIERRRAVCQRKMSISALVN